MSISKKELTAQFKEAATKGNFSEVVRLVREDKGLIAVNFDLYPSGRGNIFHVLKQYRLGVTRSSKGERCDHASVILFLRDNGVTPLTREEMGDTHCSFRWAFEQLGCVSHAACVMLLTGEDKFPEEHMTSGPNGYMGSQSQTIYNPENVLKALEEYKATYLDLYRNSQSRKRAVSCVRLTNIT